MLSQDAALVGVRALGRGLLAWMFIKWSYLVAKDPTRPAATAGPFLGMVRKTLPVPMPDDRTIVRANAAVQVVGGVMVAAGVMPRSAAAVVAGSMVPTTLAGHAYWRFEDPAERRQHHQQFHKNLAMVGGLLLLVGERRKDRA